MSALPRSAVAKLIRTMGRYAVLVPVAAASAVFALWLLALDDHPVAAFAAAPVVLPVATGAVFLAYGLLLLPRKDKMVPGVDKKAAPGVWSTWSELDPTSGSGRRLLIDAGFNASIGERRRFMGLFGRQITMTIGLPLLIALDERAVRAVIAHEVAHAELQHTSGGANLDEFIAAAGNIFEYADPDRTVTGAVAVILLDALLRWLHAEHRMLSRRNELEADRRAAERVGAHEIARSLVLIEGMRVRMDELVYEPLEKELLGAIRPPRPPLQRILRELDGIRMPGMLETAALARMTSHEDDPDATHPSLRQLLANLGFPGIPDIDPVLTSAADRLLDAAAFKELVAGIDGGWSRWAAARVEIARQ